MSRIAYVNGRYVPHASALIHVEDRGYQFADGIYEVIAIRGGLPVDFDLHYQRLCRGLEALEIANPFHREGWIVVLKRMIAKNLIRDGILYFQVTRGIAPRNHPFPAGVKPSVVITARPGPGPSAQTIAQGVAVISVPEIRWARRDIKSISLLPNVLAKQKAAEAGAYEALQVTADGVVTEAGASNAWIVDADGAVITHPLGSDILPGITRAVLITLARDAGIQVKERPFTLEEARTAREVFVTSTTAYVLSVVRVDGVAIGNGAPGSVACRLRELYCQHVERLRPETAWLPV